MLWVCGAWLLQMCVELNCTTFDWYRNQRRAVGHSVMPLRVWLLVFLCFSDQLTTYFSPVLSFYLSIPFWKRFSLTAMEGCNTDQLDYGWTNILNAKNLTANDKNIVFDICFGLIHQMSKSHWEMQCNCLVFFLDIHTDLIIFMKHPRQTTTQGAICMYIYCKLICGEKDKRYRKQFLGYF